MPDEGCWIKSAANVTEPDIKLSIDMCFNPGHVVSIVTYGVLMIISAMGNITVLTILLQRRKKTRSRINLMLTHLAIADLLVTFLMMPLEIGWAATVSWWAGDAMCRIMAFFRVFGLYLSSFVLVCISIDRYLAILRPMNIQDVDRRGKLMLAGAWIFSVFCSLPQMVVFHVESHPEHTWYHQCVIFNSFPSEMHELSYYLFGMAMMYGLPLVAIIFSYASILLEIVKRSRENADGSFRRSGLGFLGRAKIRTLKMTIIIVLVFFVCWTPYYVMCIWYWVDKETAQKVDQRVQRGLFLFACTNSCMNPIVYGAFNIRARRTQTGITRQNGVHNNRANNGSTSGEEPVNKVVWLVSWRKPSQDSVRFNNTNSKCNNVTNKLARNSVSRLQS